MQVNNAKTGLTQEIRNQYSNEVATIAMDPRGSLYGVFVITDNIYHEKS